MSNNDVILIGYSGHGYVVAESALSLGLSLRHYAETKKMESNPFDLQYIGSERDDHFEGWNGNYDFIIGIGDNKIRSQIGALVQRKKRRLINVVHSSAALANKVVLGEGVFISRKATVSPLVKIGDFCILNTACIVEHECELANGVHVAPGAVLAGNVKIGERSFVGANSTIKQGVSIGKDVVIGAGSVVLNDIPDNEIWVGVPAKRLK